MLIQLYVFIIEKFAYVSEQKYVLMLLPIVNIDSMFRHKHNVPVLSHQWPHFGIFIAD